MTQTEPKYNATSQNKQIIISKTRSGSKLKIQQKKGHGWNKIIHQRRKDFGSLENWSSEPDMKKVLLWTGYGPLQEGMLLWRRVLSDIGEDRFPQLNNDQYLLFQWTENVQSPDVHSAQTHR